MGVLVLLGGPLLVNWGMTSSLMSCFFFPQPIGNADFIVPVEIDGTIHQVIDDEMFFSKINQLYQEKGDPVENPQETGCYPLQVIQDRLCVSWLACSRLLALGVSCWLQTCSCRQNNNKKCCVLLSSLCVPMQWQN